LADSFGSASIGSASIGSGKGRALLKSDDGGSISSQTSVQAPHEQTEEETKVKLMTITDEKSSGNPEIGLHEDQESSSVKSGFSSIFSAELESLQLLNYSIKENVPSSAEDKHVAHNREAIRPGWSYLMRTALTELNPQLLEY
jgi:hypothetical protein